MPNLSIQTPLWSRLCCKFPNKLFEQERTCVKQRNEIRSYLMCFGNSECWKNTCSATRSASRRLSSKLDLWKKNEISDDILCILETQGVGRTHSDESLLEAETPGRQARNASIEVIRFPIFFQMYLLHTHVYVEEDAAPPTPWFIHTRDSAHDSLTTRQCA